MCNFHHYLIFLSTLSYFFLSPSLLSPPSPVSCRRNKDEEDEIPEWQWTIRENPAAKRSDKPSAISVAVPTVPDPRVPEPESPPVPDNTPSVPDHTPSVSEHNSTMGNGPVQQEVEPMEQGEEVTPQPPPPVVQQQKVTMHTVVCTCTVYQL